MASDVALDLRSLARYCVSMSMTLSLPTLRSWGRKPVVKLLGRTQACNLHVYVVDLPWHRLSIRYNWSIWPGTRSSLAAADKVWVRRPRLNTLIREAL